MFQEDRNKIISALKPFSSALDEEKIFVITNMLFRSEAVSTAI